jgi:hypothetical protein
MKRNFILFFSALLLFCQAQAQNRVIDATDQFPISAASIFDYTGNLIGLTDIDGDLPKISESSYPITLHCIGYEQLVIDSPQNKIWEMTPTSYELPEIEIVPVERNVLKQSFYIREYLSVNNDADTLILFMEHMAVRYIPTTKDAKFGGHSSLHVLNTRCYTQIKINDVDSISVGKDPLFPSLLDLCDLEESKIDATKSFAGQTGPNLLYQKEDKSGMSVIHKQNDQTFTAIIDLLAEKKNHRSTPFLFKLIGATMDLTQFFTTQTYRANDEHIYLPQDVLEASFVLEADGRGKWIKWLIRSKTPVKFRSMIEIFLVDSEYYTKEEAKKEHKDKDVGLGFKIPSTIPPLSPAIQELVKRANLASPRKM